MYNNYFYARYILYTQTNGADDRYNLTPVIMGCFPAPPTPVFLNDVKYFIF